MYGLCCGATLGATRGRLRSCRTVGELEKRTSQGAFGCEANKGTHLIADPKLARRLGILAGDGMADKGDGTAGEGIEDEPPLANLTCCSLGLDAADVLSAALEGLPYGWDCWWARERVDLMAIDGPEPDAVPGREAVSTWRGCDSGSP